MTVWLNEKLPRDVDPLSLNVPVCLQGMFWNKNEKDWLPPGPIVCANVGKSAAVFTPIKHALEIWKLLDGWPFVFLIVNLT